MSYKILIDVCTTKNWLTKEDKNVFRHKCKNRFPLPFLCMTFGVPYSDNLFHLLKPAFSDEKMVLLELSFQVFVLEAPVAEGGTFSEQYQKGGREKCITHWDKNPIFRMREGNYFCFIFSRRRRQLFGTILQRFTRNMYNSIKYKLFFLEWHNKYIVLILYSVAEGGYACNCYLTWKMKMNVKTTFILKPVHWILDYEINKYYCLFS